MPRERGWLACCICVIDLTRGGAEVREGSKVRTCLHQRIRTRSGTDGACPLGTVDGTHRVLGVMQLLLQALALVPEPQSTIFRLSALAFGACFLPLRLLKSPPGTLHLGVDVLKLGQCPGSSSFGIAKLTGQLRQLCLCSGRTRLAEFHLHLELLQLLLQLPDLRLRAQRKVCGIGLTHTCQLCAQLLHLVLRIAKLLPGLLQVLRSRGFAICQRLPQHLASVLPLTGASAFSLKVLTDVGADAGFERLLKLSVRVFELLGKVVDLALKLGELAGADADLRAVVLRLPRFGHLVLQCHEFALKLLDPGALGQNFRSRCL
mmetsp:Transcript_55984/g.133860  ORF Transcript_55984/g.133860 Transcript_55984/m.133860 type:complete len:319 (+) Transcript_55984:302-1258(+)